MILNLSRCLSLGSFKTDFEQAAGEKSKINFIFFPNEAFKSAYSCDYYNPVCQHRSDHEVVQCFSWIIMEKFEAYYWN